MKKIVFVIAVTMLLAFLVACGNMSIGLGNFEFKGLHCSDFSGNVKDFTVEKWYENGQGIEVKTKEAGSMFFSEGTYILYEDVCPICGEVKK